MPSNQYSDSAQVSLFDAPATTVLQHPAAVSKFAAYYSGGISPITNTGANPGIDSPKVGESGGNVQQRQNLRPSASTSQSAPDMNDLTSDLSNCDWMWDVGISSLLPIDLDADLRPPVIYGYCNSE